MTKDVIDIYAAAQKRKDAKREQSSLESDLQTVNLARAIMDMAERDKGLILSTLVDLIEMYRLDEAVADHDEIYIKGYEDGYAKACKDSDAIRREPFAQWAEQHKDKAKPNEYVYFTWAKKDNGYDV